MTNIHKAAREALPHFEEALDSALEQLQEATIKYAGYKQDKIAAMERGYQAGRAALANLRAALSEAPGEEREAFEAWYQRALLDEPVHRDRKERQWSAWQARAMLAARHSVPHGEPVAHLWQHSETGRMRVVMPDQIITADASWRVVGPLYLAARPSAPNGDERHLRRLLAARSGIPHLYTDDGEAQGQEHGVSIDFMRDSVSDIEVKLRTITVARIGANLRDIAVASIEAVRPPAATVAQPCDHLLYRTEDADKPASICDRNGEVVLSQCRLCGKAEAELIPPEAGEEGGA